MTANVYLALRTKHYSKRFTCPKTCNNPIRHFLKRKTEAERVQVTCQMLELENKFRQSDP